MIIYEYKIISEYQIYDIDGLDPNDPIEHYINKMAEHGWEPHMYMPTADKKEAASIMFRRPKGVF